jgi:hypothetical protein
LHAAAHGLHRKPAAGKGESGDVEQFMIRGRSKKRLKRPARRQGRGNEGPTAEGNQRLHGAWLGPAEKKGKQKGEDFTLTFLTSRGDYASCAGVVAPEPVRCHAVPAEGSAFRSALADAGAALP